MSQNNEYQTVQINEQSESLYTILISIFIILGIFISIIIFVLIFRICKYFNWFSKKKIILNLKNNILIVNPDEHISIGSKISTYQVTIPRCESYKYKKIKELTVQI